VAYLEATGRTELAPLRVWALAINQLYLAHRLSPAVGATLAATLETAGYRNVRSHWMECGSDANTLENMGMFYDEVGSQLQELKILSGDEIVRQQELLRSLPVNSLPGVWGIFRVACEVA
jgi:hypothetical protein